MAVYDYSKGSVQGFPAHKTGQIVSLEAEFDFAEIADTVGSSDVARLLNIPANTIVLQVWVQRVTANGGVRTADIGEYNAGSDAAIDADGWFDDLDLNATGISMSGWTHTGQDNNVPNAAFAATRGSINTTARYIGLTPNGDIAAAKIRIGALVLPILNV